MVMAIKWRLYMQAWTLKSIFKEYGYLTILTLCFIPFVRLVWFGFNEELTANPIEFITRFTGTWALVFLCITLAVTPLRRLINWPFLITYRRTLGLTCFSYAFLHFLTWLLLDHQLDWPSILADFYKRTYITVGLGAFVLLIPLAITSTHYFQRKLGRNWKRLHQLIYLIAILAPLHYWIHKAAKNNLFTVKIYVAILATLLLFRLYEWSKRKYFSPLS